MKQSIISIRLSSVFCIAALLSNLLGCVPANNQAQESTTQSTVTTVPSTEPITEQTQPSQHDPSIFTLSFAGDCTLGTSHDTYGSSGSFVKIVGDDYDYPFKNTLKYFESDDFTMVNLEGTFTESKIPVEKRFRFRAPSSYSKILTAGSVEAVNLANNHAFDFGQTGYEDTKKALETEKITYVEDQNIAYYETANGLRIGIYAAQFELDVSKMASSIQSLRSNGAELVIASIHWGIEGSYRPTQKQKDHAHTAIDAGADIVFGHHPHVLQPIETYKNGVIYYSLGNFSFGGNRNPRDKDTAIIQQTVIREPDGTIHLGETKAIPFCISSTSSKNNYQPTPYKETNSKYKRVLSKLDGSFAGRDLVVNYGPSSTTPTEGTTVTTAPQEGTLATMPTEPAPTTKPTTKPTEPTTKPTETDPVVPPTTKPKPTQPTDEFVIPI